MKNTKLSTTEILKTIKLPSKCTTLAVVRKEIKKMEKIIQTFDAEGKYIPKSFHTRLEALDSREESIKAQLATNKVVAKPVFEVEAIKTITTIKEFESMMKSAQASGYSLSVKAGDKKVISFETVTKEGRDMVTVKTDAGSKHDYWVNCSGRYTQFVK